MAQHPSQPPPNPVATPAFGLYSRRMAAEDENPSPPDITVMLKTLVDGLHNLTLSRSIPTVVIAAVAMFTVGCGAQHATNSTPLASGPTPDPYVSIIPAPTATDTGGLGGFVTSGPIPSATPTKGAACHSEGTRGSDGSSDAYVCHKGHWVLLKYTEPKPGSPCGAAGRYFYVHNTPTYECYEGNWRRMPATASPSP